MPASRLGGGCPRQAMMLVISSVENVLNGETAPVNKPQPHQLDDVKYVIVVEMRMQGETSRPQERTAKRYDKSGNNASRSPVPGGYVQIDHDD